MSALAIIKQAADCGVIVSLNGDSLALKAGAKPPADLLAKLRAHKAEIVAALRQEAPIAQPKPDEAELEERKAMSMASVPEPYLDAWARVQCQKSVEVSDPDWRQAIDDAGKFLDAWGSLVVEFQWTPGDLFDVPRDGLTGGLVWFLGGEAVLGLDPERAVTDSGRTFNRPSAQSAPATVATPATVEAPHSQSAAVAEPARPAWWPKPHPQILHEVPARYLAAWNALLAGYPEGVERAVWEGAVCDAASLFNYWGAELARLNWSADDLFGRLHGLVWTVKGRYIAVVGGSFVETTDGKRLYKGGRQ